jgi:crotonobetainyl-CoA:carnitine CoA-transferase CaiB-like acyl-CoA transferase
MTAPTARTTSDKGLLAGVRFVEIADGLAAPIAGMLLSDGGAEGVRVLDRSNPPVNPVLDAVVGRGRTQVELDLSTTEGRATLLRLIRACDVLVEDLPHGRLAGLGIDPDHLRRTEFPTLVSCSIPAFARGDVRAKLPGYDAVAATAGCLFEKPLGPPAFHGLPVASVMAGLFAANGIVAALIARLKTGRGQHVGTTLFHSTLFAQILQILIKTGVPRGFLPLKMIGTPFMRSWECKDGRWVYLHVTLPTHNARVLDVLEQTGFAREVRQIRAVLSPETARDPSQVKSLDEAHKLRRLYENVFLKRNADEWEALLGQELCCIKVRTIDEWMRDSIDAGMSDAGVVDDPVFGPLTVPGHGVTSPGHESPLRPRIMDDASFRSLMSRWETSPSDGTSALPSPGATLRHPLEGIRVADMSRIIAGPCAARVLAELGADVVSIATPGGLDWSLSFHLLFNAGKRSATIDSSDDAGKQRLWAVLDNLSPDVFLQNYRNLDVARAVGVDPDSVRSRIPNIVYTHLNAYGDRGVWAARPGFEQVVQAVSGIQMTYGKGGKPKLLPTPVIDIGSGLAGALSTLMGLYHRQRTGEGAFASTHLTWVALLLQVRHVAAVQQDKCLEAASDRGIDPRFDPGREVVAGFVPTLDGRICVAGPRAAIAEWLGQATDASDVKTILKDPIAAARRMRFCTTGIVMRSLEKSGLSDRIAVLPVVRASHLMKDIPVQDPDPVPAVRLRPYQGCPGDLAFVRNPLRMSGTPLVDVSPPPERGANTRDVLATIGVDVPQGTGVMPYPPNKALLPWLSEVIRWGWFAWRSGNV